MIDTEKLKPRFQFLVTIALFFPILLEPLLKQGGSLESGINKIMLYWGLEVAILIVSYILLECTKRWSSERIFKLINISLFANLSSFAVVLFIFAAMQNTMYISYFYLYIFGTAFPAILVIPSIIFMVLAINLFIPANKKQLA
ncbi:MAG: hypothetical protein WA101_00325 [Minisyncoccia bacterium]